jgi:hypothetical protein
MSLADCRSSVAAVKCFLRAARTVQISAHLLSMHFYPLNPARAFAFAPRAQ